MTAVYNLRYSIGHGKPCIDNCTLMSTNYFLTNESLQTYFKKELAKIGVEDFAELTACNDTIIIKDTNFMMVTLEIVEVSSFKVNYSIHINGLSNVFNNFNLYSTYSKAVEACQKIMEMVKCEIEHNLDEHIWSWEQVILSTNEIKFLEDNNLPVVSDKINYVLKIDTSNKVANY